jgi:hypothetical protein
MTLFRRQHTNRSSAYCLQALAAVFGPHEVEIRSNLLEDKAIIKCEYTMAAFSTGERALVPVVRKLQLFSWNCALQKKHHEGNTHRRNRGAAATREV